MLINRFTKITGKKVILVPYEKKHVPKYHDWMQSPELRKLTASDRLTLQEEYEMQISWTEDENKITFIVLDKQKYCDTGDEIYAMIGDTNLFLVQTDEDGTNLKAEAEIMIAEESARGRKMGTEAMMLMIHYGIEMLMVHVFFAKIAIDNTASIRLFENMGFVEKERSSVFQEVTLELIVDHALNIRSKQILNAITTIDI